MPMPPGGMSQDQITMAMAQMQANGIDISSMDFSTFMMQMNMGGGMGGGGFPGGGPPQGFGGGGGQGGGQGGGGGRGSGRRGRGGW